MGDMTKDLMTSWDMVWWSFVEVRENWWSWALKEHLTQHASMRCVKSLRLLACTVFSSFGPFSYFKHASFLPCALCFLYTVGFFFYLTVNIWLAATQVLSNFHSR